MRLLQADGALSYDDGMSDAELTMMPPDVDDLSLGRLGDFVGFRLRRIQNQLSRNFVAANADHKLKGGLFSAMAIIAANPGLSQISLAREIGLDKSLAVATVDELEKRGWAERRRSSVDRRRHALYTTPAGDAFLEQTFERLAQVEKGVLTALSASERKVLTELLDRIYKTCFRDADVPPSSSRD